MEYVLSKKYIIISKNIKNIKKIKISKNIKMKKYHFGTHEKRYFNLEDFLLLFFDIFDFLRFRILKIFGIFDFCHREYVCPSSK